PAFETLLEHVETEANRLNELGGEAFKKRDYENAKQLAEQAQKLATFRSKILNLSTEWNHLLRSAAPPGGPSTHPRRNMGKLKKGMRTPEEKFYEPILRGLVELGGSAEMNRVLQKVEVKLSKTLGPVDFQPLPSGSPSSIRWRNTAQWARNTLKDHGYL